MLRMSTTLVFLASIVSVSLATYWYPTTQYKTYQKYVWPYGRKTYYFGAKGFAPALLQRYPISGISAKGTLPAHPYITAKHFPSKALTAKGFGGKGISGKGQLVAGKGFATKGFSGKGFGKKGFAVEAYSRKNVAARSFVPHEFPTAALDKGSVKSSKTLSVKPQPRITYGKTTVVEGPVFGNDNFADVPSMVVKTEPGVVPSLNVDANMMPLDNGLKSTGDFAHQQVMAAAPAEPAVSMPMANTHPVVDQVPAPLPTNPRSPRVARDVGYQTVAPLRDLMSDLTQEY